MRIDNRPPTGKCFIFHQISSTTCTINFTPGIFQIAISVPKFSRNLQGNPNPVTLTIYAFSTRRSWCLVRWAVFRVPRCDNVRCWQNVRCWPRRWNCAFTGFDGSPCCVIWRRWNSFRAFQTNRWGYSVLTLTICATFTYKTIFIILEFQNVQNCHSSDAAIKEYENTSLNCT